MNAEEKKVLDAVASGPKQLSQLVVITGFTERKVCALLVALEDKLRIHSRQCKLSNGRRRVLYLYGVDDSEQLANGSNYGTRKVYKAGGVVVTFGDRWEADSGLKPNRLGGCTSVLFAKGDK